MTNQLQSQSRTKDELIAMARAAASEHNLDPQLVCAVVEQESDWDPGAIRMEEEFFLHYIKPLKLAPSESVLRATSFGLMQIMGEVAVELGFIDSFDKLCEPDCGLQYGCWHLKNKFREAGNDVHKALLLWNGGGDPLYADQVLARMAHYA
jgi:soluble lytic murein transglycosylase-like protein